MPLRDSISGWARRCYELWKERLRGLCRQRRHLRHLVVRDQGNQNNPANADSSTGKEGFVRDAGVQAHNIAVEHRSNSRIVVQLQAERLIVNTYNSSPEGSSIL